MPLSVTTYGHYKKNNPVKEFNSYREERQTVLSVIEEVRTGGDEALFKLTRKFDQAELDNLVVSKEEIADALKVIEHDLLAVIREAKDNIERFHRRQLQETWWDEDTGWKIGQRVQALQSVGAYVPGGTAAYPSSVLMTVIPAKVAGVNKIYICTPPDKDGRVNPLTLVAANEAGADAIFKIGGAQAVAALAFGTETIPAVQKIVGPGNIYVTLAKKEVYGQVGIDMLAGPSEIVIIADDAANPVFIAADLLSQAEHDPLSRSILITTSEELALSVSGEVTKQLAALPRKEIAEKAIREKGAVILVEHLGEAWSVVNELAPEHLELHVRNAWDYLDKVKNAGAIFIGPFSPESLGDYWAGSNHVLPTGTAARYASALGVADFIKHTNVLYYTEEALMKSAPKIAAIARAEGLEAHARAVLIRRQENGSTK
ncbi:MAG: histidinol dehydrogenase [Bacillota bacterium]|nr:histidinol dehydrogenase [Bacillota bacterium]